MLTENEAENMIRESLYSVKMRELDFEQFLNFIDTTIKVRTFDVLKNLKKWITEEVYNQIIKELFLFETHSHVKYSEYHRSLIINYNNTEEDRVFGLIFLCWGISLCKNNSTKIECMFQLIKAFNASYNGVTYETFTNFLSTFLKINLLYFTDQIKNCIRYPTLLSQFEDLHKIYNENNLQKLERQILNDTEILMKKQKGINKILKNESIDLEIIERLFEKHYYLLDCVELRNYFYIQYSNAF